MEWLKSKTTIFVAGFLALIGLGGYGVTSMRGALEDQIGSLKGQIQSIQSENNAKAAELTSNLDTVTSHLGTVTQDLQQSQSAQQRAERQLENENTQTAQRLRRELAAKADQETVVQVRAETVDKLSEVQQEATTKIAGVSGQVDGVRTDLNATRDDLADSKRDLKNLIAHNASELAELRRKGDRNYVEFDIARNQQVQHFNEVQIQLKKTDVKRQKFDVTINADDSSILKKDRTANEPITFLVGRDRLRYELVVNYVDKDRIRGYLSSPKDKTLSAEAPKVGSLQQ